MDQLGAAALAYADDRFVEARELYESAFRQLHHGGDLQGAARVATHLAALHAGILGNVGTGNGWLDRAHELLEAVGPCVEWGYWELAYLACDRPDADELGASAGRALAIARDHGDLALEVRALADGGLALVSQGRVREGFEQLDRAIACLGAGEVTDPYVIGTSLCSLLTACDRAGDVARATESVRLVEQLVLGPTGGRPRVLGTHCKLALGGALCAAGRWDEAELTLLEATGPAASTSVGHRSEATARLAELLVAQGRIDDAAALLEPIEDAIAAAGPLAAVHLTRGDAGLAAAVLRQSVRRLGGDVLRAAPLVASLVQAEVARGDTTAAGEACSLLRSMANAVATPLLASLASIADGRVALAERRTTDAITAYEAALAALSYGERPLLAATVQLEAAGAHRAASDDNAAVACARAAHAAARRIRATAIVDEAAALLRALGVTVARDGASRAKALGALTAREADVLAGIRRGDSNAEIAARLFLSPKTVEHHVSRILAKLGVRTRAEAAAVAGPSPARG